MSKLPVQSEQGINSAEKGICWAESSENSEFKRERENTFCRSIHASRRAAWARLKPLADTETGNMPHAETDDGVRLYYEETGAGTPLIFVHEYAGDPSSACKASGRHSTISSTT